MINNPPLRQFPHKLRKFVISKIFLLTLFFVTVIVILSFFLIPKTSLFKKTELLTPLGELLNTVNPVTASPKIVYGFLPFWQLKTATIQPELTHLAYFSLTLDKDGQIVTGKNNQADPGYRNFQSSAFQEVFANTPHTEKSIVISAFDSQDIETFLQSPQAQLQFHTTLDFLFKSNDLQHLNVDIEYSGTQSAKLQPRYTQFCHNLKTYLDTNHPEIQLSIDVYPSAIKGTNLWNIKDLQSCVDHFIIMGYDFYRASSITAGPIAPLLAEGGLKEEKNIVMYLSEYLQVLPPEQIILGVPFYGYEWQTVSDQPRAQTFPRTGATASYERIQSILSQPDIFDAKEYWEDATLSPYLTYKQNDLQKVIFYENERSLQYKLDLVSQSNLAGIAIWALGYEGEHRNLWDVIGKNFNTF